VILFTGSTSVITRVPAVGGTPKPVLTLDEKLGPRIQIAPVFLPDGHHFIYASTVPGAGIRGVYLASLDSPDSTLLLPGASSNTAYANGYLLFLRDATLFAQAFDVGSLTLGADAIPLAEQIQINPTTGTGAFTASQNGVLAYQTSSGGGGTTLAWFDRTGRKVSALAERSGYLDVELSHAGNRASVSRLAESRGSTDVYVYDVERKFPTQITFGPERSGAAIWMPSDTRLIYSVQRETGSALVMKSPTGGTAEVLFEDKAHNLFPLSVSPDGGLLLYNEVTRAMQGKLVVLPLRGERKPYVLLNSGFSETPGQFCRTANGSRTCRIARAAARKCS
jgi:eukaryotic-like serine/threonine-protein kinase